jgi:hypothetical protein
MTYWRTSRATSTMKEGPLLSDLREWLDYNPADGGFIRKKKPRNHIDGNTIAGGFDKAGYVRIRVMGRKYLAHRLAWLWVHGEWPALLVDHIDGNKSNNRISNLRLATPSENARNRGRNIGCGEFPMGGVSRERYRARIKIDGKSVHLGSFDTEQEARACYLRVVEENRRVTPSSGAQR